MKFDTEWVLIPSLEQMDGLSVERMEELLKGVSRDTLRDAWGKPNDQLTYYSGDIFHVPESFTSIIVYYDGAGFIERVQTDQRNQAVS